jgi:hypothetical protein
LAISSLRLENPTIDEVLHLPAGVTYWQTGSFRNYPHNPPLVKLLAALPVLAANPVTSPIYSSAYWREDPPNKAGIGHLFAELNASRYFELFTSARMLMPLFGVAGGIATFLWSRKLFGTAGGFLSLFLWCACPNILAHTRLVTTDVAAASIGVLATFVFWRSLYRPSWVSAAICGALLGIAQLTKFSLLILCGVWPFLWLTHVLVLIPRSSWRARCLSTLGHAVVVILACLLVINLGYGFEGTGLRLGSYRFHSALFTIPRDREVHGIPRPVGLFERIEEGRANRFSESWLSNIPVPLPRAYVQGFDDQKLEADGVWARYLVPPELGDQMGSAGDRIVGYPVYLNGELRSKSWAEYYLLCLLYKVPEGTIALTLAGVICLFARTRSWGDWADAVALLAVPCVVLCAMSFGTNINLGLRYVLPAFPYLFILAGGVIPAARSLRVTALRKLGFATILAAILSTSWAVASIHPHYLAYFNFIAGGPDRGAEHLIDSNLDWGQDLVGLRRWILEIAQGEQVGIAYFGQINPEIFRRRGEPIPWYLPPARPGTMSPSDTPASHRSGAPGERLRPGLYAVSASLVRGLDWRVYDPYRWAPYRAERHAFSYFQELTPIASIGHSILIYRLTESDVTRLESSVFRPRAGAGPS